MEVVKEKESLMLGDAQQDLRYIIIIVYIMIGGIDDATAGIGINDVHRHTSGDGMIHNLWN